MKTEPRPSFLSSADRSGVVRYFHPEKTPALRRMRTSSTDVLPMTALLAQTDTTTVSHLQNRFAIEVRRRAAQLLQLQGFAEQVQALPFREGEVIAALGDSITDDAISWAYLLQEVLDQARPSDRIVVINHGITGHTTGEVISRLDTVLLDEPTWVIQLIGTNDARWHGRSVSIQTTSLAESVRNLRGIRTLLNAVTAARYVIMTPPPIIDDATMRWPSFQQQQIAWRDADVRRLGEAIRQESSDIVDLYTAFTEHGLTGIMQEDGVHPTEDGQELILRRLVAHLADITRNEHDS